MRDSGAAKKALRRRLLALREALSPWTRQHLAHRIYQHLFAIPEFARARWVHLYAAVRGEVPTRELMHLCLSQGKRVVVPRVLGGTGRLEFSEILDPDADLVPGFRGIPEPRPARFRPVSPDVLEVLILPGIGFDWSGRRLGSGRGFYDRLLATLPRRPLCVGLAFSCQVVSRLPAEDHDISVDWVVTELEGWPTGIRSRHGREEGQEDHARTDH